MLENVCYDFFEMLTLNMARLGFFGEIIHGEGAYIHDLMDHNFSKTVYADMWRLEENSGATEVYIQCTDWVRSASLWILTTVTGWITLCLYQAMIL
jgi:hypothetical protein